MSFLGRVRIGHKAPDFHCDAVVKGLIEEKTLSSYISPTRQQWLILLFIPAAFSFVCPTEVLAFQNCLDEFQDRNCDVVFVSVDTKHSLWHWQNVPRHYGGLGQIDIALLSDANHRMSRDYGVLIEEEGVCLRGLFILDDKAIVQQITLNNLTVGRSVLEALRLLEAFQAVAKHGVLCPIDWKPSTNTTETIHTISNTLTDSYEERLANLQKEFGDIPITDLDAKHKSVVSSLISTERRSASTTSMVTRTVENPNHISTTATYTASGKAKEDEDQRAKDKLTTTTKDKPHTPSPKSSPQNIKQDCLSRRSGDKPPSSHIASAPASTPAPPAPLDVPTQIQAPSQSCASPPPVAKRSSSSFAGTARHSRGHSTAPFPPLHKPHTYESRRGTHVILEFADPTSSPQASPNTTPSTGQLSLHSPNSYTQFVNCPSSSSHNSNSTPSSISPSLSRSGSQFAHARPAMPSAPSPKGGQTRMQATFEALKKMGAGLSSPRVDFSPRKNGNSAKETGAGTGTGTGSGDGNGNGKVEGEWGYFDVVPEIVET